MRTVRWWGVRLAMLGGWTVALQAQTADAGITGVVVDTAGRPVADADVLAREAATGAVVRVRTGASGRFALLQLSTGDAWTVEARRVGSAPDRRTGLRLRLGDRLDLRLVLRPLAVQLDELVVSGDADAGRLARRQRIGGSTLLDTTALRALPVVGRNFTDLAALSPLAGGQQSLGGQRYTATDIRLDGLQAKNLLRAGEYGGGPYTVSLEAIQSFEVVTNVYDVTQGRAGGGTISAITRSGTNRPAGSVFAVRRSAGLSAPTDYLGRGRDLRDFTLTQFGGSVAGPLVRDRLHALVAFDRQVSDEPLFTGLIRTAQDAQQLEVAADSLVRLQGILAAVYGLDTAAAGPQLGRLERRPVANTLLTRLDWTLNDRHRLTLRHNYSDWNSPLSGGVDQVITLREARSDLRSVEHQALGTLRSTFGAATRHELTVGVSSSVRRLVPQTLLPRGFVRIRSTLPDGSPGDVRVQFGGNRLAPDDSRELQFQWQQRLTAQRGAVLLSAGMDHSLARLRTRILEAQSGLFEFNSLEDLAARRANRFSRAVPLQAEQGTAQWVADLGAFAQAEWALRPALSATVGVRWDASAFLARPPANPLVEQGLGLRTDRRPQDWLTLQPRAQLVWAPAGGRDVVRVGGGLFSSQLPFYAQHNALQFTGLSLADVDLRTGVPVPDYPAYRADPSRIPGLPAGQPTPPAYVNLVSPSVRLPTTWKGSLSWQRSVGERISLTLTALASRSRGNYQYIDRNLVSAPAFRLANEANRPVFVPAATIDALGRTDVRNALAAPALGRVLELQSVGEGTQRAAIAELAWAVGNGGAVTASYTWNRSRDNSTYGCCLARAATTWTAVAGDPRDLAASWAPSDLDFRHKAVLAVVAPRVRGVQLSGRYVGQTGRRFSLVTNLDINGDEAAGNDLAFLFDPDDPATDPAVAAAMRRLLANPANVARDYIAANLGRVSGRNAIAAPWTGRVDVRLATELRLGRGGRAELTLDCFNFLNLLDRDWGGQYLLPAGISNQNPVLQRIPLLNVTGFDRTTNRYRYTVNESAGVLAKQGDPYTLQLGLRYGF